MLYEQIPSIIKIPQESLQILVSTVMATVHNSHSLPLSKKKLGNGNL